MERLPGRSVRRKSRCTVLVLLRPMERRLQHHVRAAQQDQHDQARHAVEAVGPARDGPGFSVQPFAWSVAKAQVTTKLPPRSCALIPAPSAGPPSRERGVFPTGSRHGWSIAEGQVTTRLRLVPARSSPPRPQAHPVASAASVLPVHATERSSRFHACLRSPSFVRTPQLCVAACHLPSGRLVSSERSVDAFGVARPSSLHSQTPSVQRGKDMGVFGTLVLGPLHEESLR
jgi:hypothetical protein